MKDPTTSTDNNKGNSMFLPSGYNLPQRATPGELMQPDTLLQRCKTKKKNKLDSKCG